MSQKHGFTLIELLVTIAIIGILAAIATTTAGQVRMQGRDARRKSDLELIRSGLEIYKSDCKAYPSSLSSGSALSATCAGSTNTYINSVPSDPQASDGKQYIYSYDSSTKTYSICAALETGSGTQTCGGASNCGSATCNYKVISP